MDDYAIYVALLFLICLSAFFSATETAYSTVNKLRIKQKAEEKNKKAMLAYTMLEAFDRTLTTVLIGNNIVNIAASSMATVLAVKIFGNNGAAIATAAMTVLILTFGEILPKCIVNEKNEKYVLFTSYIIKIISFLFYPFTFVFLHLKQFVIKSLPSKKEEQPQPTVTEQELKFIVENIEEEGVLEKQESELVQSALVFDEKTIQEILTPRVDMVAIDLSDDQDKNDKIILNTRFSRLPVYEKDTDKIVGVLYTKDYMQKKINGKNPKIRSLMVPAYFVYKTNKLSTVLNEFQKRKIQIAIVTDDYGGTLGLVTLEDLIEQLVGDIWDEDEAIDPDCVKTFDGNYNVSGDMSIRDMFEILEINTDNLIFEHKTMGGWAFEEFARIPQIGDSFSKYGLTVEVTQMNEQRITRMLIKRNSSDEDNAQ